MAANFSGAVKLADLNDFIAPSQACVVNLNSNKTAQLALEDDLQVDAVQLQPKASKGFSQTQLAGPTDAIKVTLHDCLACSGCITSAETVLLEHQSVDELLANLAQPDVTVIVSLSPQSRASLAAFYKLTPTQAVKRLTHFFKSLGVKYVFDTSCSRDLALLETAHEFIHRYHTRHRGATDLASAAGASSSDMDIDGDRSAAEPHSNGRTAPEANGTSSNGVHFVMPCYDKKLEASRDDFNVPGTPIPEVDSVLTSSEVQLLLEARGADLAAMPDAPLDSMLSSVGPDGQLYGVSGGSGGYLEFTFRTAAKQLFGQELPPGPLDMRPPHTMRTRRNTDFREYHHRKQTVTASLKDW
ncbi:hypothetical protein WJX72_010779 [[Myrmecia] bisecta]|uniref:Iron hydrogenase large subunit C-terminal domain-containing protein n=1 Tax=[Myrmecia] bisecta TaxID=41462 RepID=A0AAW1R8Z6_9CHLO